MVWCWYIWRGWQLKTIDWVEASQWAKLEPVGTSQSSCRYYKRVYQTDFLLFERWNGFSKFSWSFESASILSCYADLSHDRSSFFDGVCGGESAVRLELQLSKGNEETTFLNNKNSLDTITFKYSSKGHICIALVSRAFSDFIYSWLRSVYDCYTLYSKSARQSHQKHNHTNLLQNHCNFDKYVELQEGATLTETEKPPRQPKILLEREIRTSSDMMEDDPCNKEVLWSPEEMRLCSLYRGLLECSLYF